MPRYQTLQPDEIEYVKKQGLDPEKYLYDAEGQQLISREDAPDLTLMESGLETLKAVGGGFLSGLAGIPRGVEKLLSVPERAAASSLESLTQGGQLTDSPELQRRTGAMRDQGMLGKALEGVAGGIESLKPDVDPRLGWLPRMTGEFGGTAASLLVPGGAARYLGAGPKMAGALTTGLAGSQIFGNVSAAEEARQKAAGETPSDTKEILKAAGVTGAMLPLYHLLGPSRFFNSTAPASSLGELGKRVGVHALSGGGLAGTQRALEDAVIAGEVNPADIGKSIVAGGLAQGLTGAGAEYYSARNAPPVAKAVVDVDSAPVPPAQPQVPKPKAMPEVTRLTDEQVDVLLRLPPGELPPNNGPVHKAIDKGKAEGWVRTPEDVRVLEDAVISAPKDQADTALKSAMDGLWYKNVANRPAASAEEAARNIQAGYYEFFNETFPREVKELSAGRKNLEGMRKWVEKLQKDAVKAQETGQLGFATDAQTQMQAALENIKRAETDVRAKEMELLRQWNAKHAPVNPPAAPMPAPARPVAPAPAPTPAPTPAPAPTPVPTPPQPAAAPRSFIPPIQTDDPSILNPRRPLEGEQGSPFGEQTRYSGFFPPTLLEKGKELARRARVWLNEDQVQAGTFMLSGVAGLNQERPWGMQVSGSGELPVSGLVPKMAANIPKGEMEAYKAAGLEKWLEGKGKVSREELQQWMMENGPQVEVKELRPTGASPAEKRRADAIHALDTQYPNWRDTLDDFPSWPPEKRQLFDAYKAASNDPELINPPRRVNNDSTIGRYNVEPRPVKEMEGPVELLVRVPFGQRQGLNAALTGNSVSGFMFVGDGFKQKSPLFKTQQEAEQWYKRNPQWTGGHHGESGRNTLGFGRANIETLPDGRRVLHVFEAQSDWGQRVRKEQEEGKSYTPTHPLLDESNRLILKAAVKYALDNNLDGIAISDAETAMITEGHDAAGSMVRRADVRDMDAYLEHGYASTTENPAYAYGDDWQSGTFVLLDGNTLLRVDKPEYNRFSPMPDQKKNLAKELRDAGYGQKEGAYIPQEGGMRLNYDPGAFIVDKSGNVVERFRSVEDANRYMAKLPRNSVDGPFKVVEGQLNKIAKELTGHEGERVSFGEHWKAQQERPSDDGSGTLVGPRENLIFKNPDGSPKTDITARVYPLDKARRMFDDQTAFTLFGRDQAYYSSLGLTREQVAKISEFFSKVIKNPDFAKRDPFSMVSRAVTSRMAGLSPSGGMMKWVFDGKLRPMRDAYSNELTALAQEFEPFVKSAEGKAWIERSNSTGTWDFAGLTPEQAKQAKALVDTIEWTRDNATAKGVWVKDIDNAGNVTYRPGEKQPGWFPFMPSDKVYEAAARDNAEWKQFKKDFVAHWEAQRGPNSTEQALEALRHFIPSLDNGVGGEPLFSPLILPAGMTLPESWRSENLMDSWNRYARRYAQHMSWAENIQNDPVGRRLFGLQENGKGEKDTAEITWADVPDAWKYAVREGRRVRARWALAADPNKPPSELIEPFMESGLMRDMMAGYRQGNSSAPLLQAGSAATSAMILGIISGVRDVGMSTVLSGTYGEYGKTIRSVVDYLADPKGEKAKARAAGAMQADLLSPEVAATGRTMGQALLTVAQKLRRLGGPISREELDNMGRVVIFETARRLILEGRPSGKALVEEFGPAYTAGLTPEQIADQTAARLSSRQSGTSDPSNLPGWMLPQTGNPLGHFFALGRWSAARYNNFVEDTWNPFLNGKKKESAERFFKLALGGLVVSSAIQSLVNVLFDRKPDHLTWGEFLNIMDDPKIPAGKKATEAAYLMAANTQLLGSFGWVGDLVLAGVRSAAGGRTQGKPLDTQYPALIFANQMYNTVTSYLDALRDGRANLGIHDLTALMWEIAKGAQNGKMAARLAELAGVKDVAEKREIRNQRVYERVLEQQTGSARPVAPGTAREIPSVTDPFAAQNRFMNMAPERFGEYSEFLLGRRRGGSPYQLQANWLQHPSYYGNLARITGEKAAEEEKKRDRAMEQEILRRNAALLKVK